MDPAVRRDQLDSATADVVDPRLPAGRLGVPPGAAWTLVATVTGAYGPALGSYTEVADADADQFAIDGVDVRELMIRQMWGARVLQNGASLPDCEANDRWTFTLFPGEGLTDGLAGSGTVLKGKVRFRLGKPDRGISSARVAPAIVVPQTIPDRDTAAQPGLTTSQAKRSSRPCGGGVNPLPPGRGHANPPARSVMDVPARLARSPDAWIYLRAGSGSKPGPSCSSHPLPGPCRQRPEQRPQCEQQLHAEVTGDG